MCILKLGLLILLSTTQNLKCLEINNTQTKKIKSTSIQIIGMLFSSNF